MNKAAFKDLYGTENVNLSWSV